MADESTHKTEFAPGDQCECDPCPTPRAKGGRCPSEASMAQDADAVGVTTSPRLCHGCGYCLDEETDR